MKKYIAELVGTFTLTLIVTLSLSGTFPVATPVLAGLTLALFVYTIGHISGCHINPGVTIGAWSIGKIRAQETIFYIVSQFIGAGLAVLLIKGLDRAIFVVNIDLGHPATFAIGLAEFVGMVLFTFGIASVIYKKIPEAVSGLVIGGSLLLGIALAVLMGSSGFLNPAVAFGANSLDLAYLCGPILGGVAGMWLYKFVNA